MVSSNNNTTRQRLNAKKSKKKAESKKESTRSDSNKKENTSTSDSNQEDKEPSMWDTFKGHWGLPFFGITVAVMIPYFLHSWYLYLRLERPDLVADYTQGLVRWRPAVTLEGIRPVLIVGTISGATTQVAHDLQYHMDLEVCHENSGTTRHFCRDGTVSWMHGLRFLNRTTDKMQHYRSLAALCTNFTPSMGFHPRMFRDNSKCSIRTKWGRCWAKECLDLIHHEWGCAWNEIDGDDSDNKEDTTNPGTPCQTPYARTLHQTRHPLRTVESLVSKFCPNNQPIDEGFAQMVHALFPQHDFGSYSCLQSTSYYVLEYHKAMRRAVQAGLIQQTYQVEETTPCQVASLGGLDGFGGDTSAAALWKGSREAVTRACQDPQGPAHEPMTSTEYKVNDGKVTLTPAYFSADLWNQLVDIAHDLGYQDVVHTEATAKL
mmetsp:Transcript_49603/g.120326  ORF Transcript_49603/g.120326 Transcript_49603/m.120326 type:complete len:432 (-) Transcript_49603:717-2012(-)|eukprot:CAMPEP_0113447200 /NCGR_PEP_ID=MMETSP0014_2-20120614/4112_1 /TAXON_ID=2857 /ORGANISM="Nitzschia sp." /LENGTH=431 /DNA_ID=CAMNT_0000338341 /DNA_START=115 /DNA_END=1410 /DNA_ORIENTATION=+ /assembly_acc=CAM_ASM_000159